MPETITIRTTGPDDIAAVDALLSRSYPALLKADYPPSVMVTAVPIISRARPELVGGGTYYIAEDLAGRPLGAGGWTAQRRRPERADIRHIVTDPDQTRRGVGRVLMEHVFREAAFAGISSFDCLATFTAVPFYRALGFVEVGETEVPLAPGIGFPAIRMVRQVGRPA